MDTGRIGICRTYARTSVAARVMLTVVMAGAALLSGCVGAVPEDQPAQVADDGPAFDATSLRWDPSAVAAATPGLLGWRRESPADPGAVVALKVDGDQARTVWAAPDTAGVTFTPLAVDVGGQRILLEVNSAGAADGLVTELVMLDADGTSRALNLPDGYEGVSSATFVGGRALAVVYHATPETFETRIGVFSEAGEWQPLALEGPVPDHQFVEWAVSAPGTDAVAVLLKVPGGVGDRDDDALVFARVDSETLRVYTDPFLDDSLPAATPLYGAEGVVYPRTWREVGGVPVVDLIVARWNGAAWDEESVLDAGAVASGIETGQVVSQGADGTLWVRSAADDAGTATLMRLTGTDAGMQPTSVAVEAIDWFTWVDSASD